MRRRLTRAQRDHGSFVTRHSNYEHQVPEQEGPPIPPHIEAERDREYWGGILGEPYPWETDTSTGGQNG